MTLMTYVIVGNMQGEYVFMIFKKTTVIFEKTTTTDATERKTQIHLVSM